jgi:hypothetical protein
MRELDDKVNYLYLNKNTYLMLQQFFDYRCKNNDVTIVQAHSSSFLCFSSEVDMSIHKTDLA